MVIFHCYVSSPEGNLKNKKTMVRSHGTQCLHHRWSTFFQKYLPSFGVQTFRFSRNLNQKIRDYIYRLRININHYVISYQEGTYKQICLEMQCAEPDALSLSRNNLAPWQGLANEKQQAFSCLNIWKAKKHISTNLKSSKRLRRHANTIRNAFVYTKCSGHKTLEGLSKQ